MSMSSSERSRHSRARKKDRQRERAKAQSAAVAAPSAPPTSGALILHTREHTALVTGGHASWASRALVEAFLRSALHEGAQAVDAETAELLTRHLGIDVAVAPPASTPKRRTR